MNFALMSSAKRALQSSIRSTRPILFVLAFVWFAPSATADEMLRFNRDVRPILTDKCFACHGPDAQTVEGGLRLDLREQAVEDSGAIVPGDAEASEVIARVFAEDADLIMPPPNSHKKLTNAEKKVLARWINEGAIYEQHWAFEPMRPDALDRAESVTMAIDTTIDSKLAELKLSPAETADPVTLIRRLSFDLNGLPPNQTDVESFVRDPSKANYVRLVDQYLNSPRFGERMAVYWLDLVRYADTVGYHGDQNVSQSPYRDYVIRSFNSNKPYDQFVREQLAGDLIPDQDLQTLVASGYNRLNQTTEEGGSQAKEYLAIYFADRVRNVSQVFLGATMGCAQCHDHKYDPYTTRDFYSLGAFFADLDERGVYSARSRPPMIPVPTAEQQSQIEAIDLKIESLRKQTEPLRQELLRRFAEWEENELANLDQPRLQTTSLVDEAEPTGARLSGEWKFIEPDFPPHSGKFVRRQASDGLTQHFFEKLPQPVDVETGTRFFSWVYLDPKSPPDAIMLQINDGDWNQRKVWGSDAISYGRQTQSNNAYRRAGGLPEIGTWVRLEVDAGEVGLKAGDKVNGIAFSQFGGNVYWDEAGVEIDMRRSEAFREAIETPASERHPDQTKQLHDTFVAQTEPMQAHLRSIDQLQSSLDAIRKQAPQTVISKAVDPRPIRVLPRGNWMDDSGELVMPAIPEFLGRLEIGDRRATRLDLADWICDPNNPLTARTMANRVWKLLFGRGICQSVDDLGGQGTYPSYPDLLDALAIDFVRSGWDVKQLIRSVVLSDAYQRRSTPTPQQLADDPYNEWFARQGRFGLDAEMVRDTALWISGLLVEQVGGESVRPYQPAGYYAQLNFPRRQYVADQGDAQYRRGLYTHWQRTFLHPMMKAFDAPSREECTASRARSNTPLQALVLLNDPTFVEAARVFAERIMREGGENTEAKIEWAYQIALSRPIDEAIAMTLRQLFRSHLSHYQRDHDAAIALLSQGNAAADPNLNAAEVAAWASVARVLLNLNESITRY